MDINGRFSIAMSINTGIVRLIPPNLQSAFEVSNDAWSNCQAKKGGGQRCW
jgi:hypothetical protein